MHVLETHTNREQIDNKEQVQDNRENRADRTEQMLKWIQEVQHSGDTQTAAKMEESMKDWIDQTLNIGFCGHFSAGKSTMINRLLDQSLLPSSPIPTSANVVRIGFGTPRATIVFATGQTLELGVEEISKWKSYCRDGQEVQKVEMYTPHPILQGNVQFLDTPGIDSTDDAHQSSTEAALHMADVILFVTDYNHVQSEHNFTFIQSLKEKGKIVFLIVNQIDKHRRDELSVSQYQQRLEKGFAEWGISLDGILLTSLTQPDDPYNQLDQLKQLLLRMRENKDAIIDQQFLATLHSLWREHQEFLRQEQEPAQLSIQEQIEALKIQVDYAENPSYLEQYRRSQEQGELWTTEVEQETKALVDQAIITPYTTTRLAEELIASYQSGFKAGWFPSRKKKEAEQNRRMEALYSDLAERMKSQMEWHLQELLRKKAETFAIHDRRFVSKLVDWEITVPKEWLTEMIQPGVVSREYVYTYTQYLTAKIKRLYKQQMEQWAREGRLQLDEQHQQTYAGQQATIDIFTQIKQLQQSLERMDEEIAEYIRTYTAEVDRWVKNEAEKQQEHGLLDWKDIVDPTSNPQRVSGEPEDRSLGNGEKGNAPSFDRGQAGQKRSTHPTNIDPSQRHPLEETDSFRFSKELTHKARQLSRAAAVIEAIPQLQTVAAELRQKAERLGNNRFTISLFGAFSAGKSSFANALLGESILPVSPNPTTAALNHIVGATDKYPSGSATIHMKTQKQLELEITAALERLKLPVQSSQSGPFNIWEGLSQIESVPPEQLRPSLMPYYSFLSACQQGWEMAHPLLGQSFDADQDQFEQFVAVEEKACFVEKIKLYVDSPLIESGVEMIDTPGADSIHARHTDVTFNYIKNADVILFVTYYNHAFSRADQLFLDQLGRVKNQFALDKMFFIVNAADLAASDEELETVVEYVQENMLQSGIRFPKTFPVSSLRAIKGEPGSGLEEFRQSFLSFIQSDLTGLLLQSAEDDLQRGEQLLVQMKEEQYSTLEVKEATIHSIQGLKSEWMERINREKYSAFLKEIDKEIEEHMYYVKQRLFYSFTNHVNQAFHPSILSSTQHAQQQLQYCLDELFYSILAQLKDELQATSLRMENALVQMADRVMDTWQRTAENEKIMLNGSGMEHPKCGVPTLPDRFHIEHPQEWAQLLKSFKNPKQFFEQGGKEALRQELEQKIQGLIDRYLSQSTQIFRQFYHNAWEQLEITLKQTLQENIALAIGSRLSVLKGEVSVDEVEETLQAYSKIRKS